MNLLPFDSVKTCPACRYPIYFRHGASMRYSTDIVEHVGDGKFASVQNYGDGFAPHLEKHCGQCGYGWLEQTATEVIP